MKAKEVGLAVGVMSASAALVGLGSRLRHAHGDGAAAAEGTAVLVEGRIALSAMIALVDSRLTSLTNALEVIASTEEAQSGDWERIRPLLVCLAEEYPQSLVQWTLPDGTTYLVDTGLYPAKVADRHYFHEAMAGRKTVAELLISRATGKSSVVTAVPVKSGAKTAGLVVVSQFLEPLNRWLAQSLRLPESIGFGAADAEGKIVLDDELEFIFRDLKSLGSPSLNRAFSEMQTGQEGTTTFEIQGKGRKAVYATSPLTGWHYELSVRR